MYNYDKSVLSPYDPTKLAIHSFLRPEVDLMFIDEENMVSYVDFDCGITFFPETPTKIKQINRERNYISRFHKKSQYIASNDHHTSSVDNQHSFKIFLNPDNLWDMGPAAPMSLNHSNDTYSMFNQYPQLTTQKPRTDSNPVFSSVRTMDSNRKRLRVSFAFLQRYYLPDGRINETVAKVEELSNLWKSGAMDGTPQFVMNCNCL